MSYLRRAVAMFWSCLRREKKQYTVTEPHYLGCYKYLAAGNRMRQADLAVTWITRSPFSSIACQNINCLSCSTSGIELWIHKSNTFPFSTS